MADAEKKIPEFKKTMMTGVVLRRIDNCYYHNYPWLFDECPAFEVRKAILRHCLDHSVKVYEEQADWAEARIHDLKKEEGETESRFWEELLNWYVFNAEDTLINRAVDFAIGLTKLADFGGSHGFAYRSNVLKIVAGKLDRSPEICEHIKTSALRLFLESFLVSAYESRIPIYDCAMVDIKRVVRCLIRLEEWSFLPTLEKVLFKFCNQKRPERYDFKEEVTILENLAFLRETVRFFKEKAKEE